MLQQESPQEVLENSPTAVVAEEEEEFSPHPSLPLTARFYSPPLARKSAAKMMVMKADLTWGVHEDPVEMAIEKAKRASLEKGKGKGKGKKGNRGIKLF